PRVLHGAQDLDAPILGVGALIAETLEGNPHLHLVAPIGHAAARLVHVVGVQVDRRVEPATRARTPGGAGGDAIAPACGLWHADRIHREHRGAAAVAVRGELAG